MNTSTSFSLKIRESRSVRRASTNGSSIQNATYRFRSSHRAAAVVSNWPGSPVTMSTNRGDRGAERQGALVRSPSITISDWVRKHSYALRSAMFLNVPGPAQLMYWKCDAEGLTGRSRVHGDFGL